jgi:hypothetical protein
VKTNSESPTREYKAPFAPKILPPKSKKDPNYHPTFAPTIAKKSASRDFSEELRDAYLEENEFCFFCLLKGILRPAIYVHHLLRRITHPEFLNNKRNFVQVCAICHLILHNQAETIEEQEKFKAIEQKLIHERGLDG